MKQIYFSFSKVLHDHDGKRRATIWKGNDGSKNIYTIYLEIVGLTPEEVRVQTLFTFKNALRLASAFLDVDSDEFYWSESIPQFLDRYEGRF